MTFSRPRYDLFRTWFVHDFSHNCGEPPTLNTTPCKIHPPHSFFTIWSPVHNLLIICSWLFITNFCNFTNSLKLLHLPFYNWFISLPLLHLNYFTQVISLELKVFHSESFTWTTLLTLLPLSLAQRSPSLFAYFTYIFLFFLSKCYLADRYRKSLKRTVQYMCTC